MRGFENCFKGGFKLVLKGVLKGVLNGGLKGASKGKLFLKSAKSRIIHFLVSKIAFWSIFRVNKDPGF